MDTNNSLVVNTKPIVEINTGIVLAGYKTELPIKIIADFTDIPESQHEVFLDTFKYFYNTEVNLYPNSFNHEPKTIKEKKRDWRLNKIVDVIFNRKKDERTN